MRGVTPLLAYNMGPENHFVRALTPPFRSGNFKGYSFVFFTRFLSIASLLLYSCSRKDTNYTQ